MAIKLHRHNLREAYFKSELYAVSRLSVSIKFIVLSFNFLYLLNFPFRAKELTYRPEWWVHRTNYYLLTLLQDLLAV